MKEGIDILVVDDEESIVFSLEFLLKKEGYHVRTAANGVLALEAFKEAQPDIILLDVMMPEMDGYETAKQIRALDPTSKTSIIFLTAKGTTRDRREGYMSGADDYVVKPFENEAILEKIREKTF